MGLKEGYIDSNGVYRDNHGNITLYQPNDQTVFPYEGTSSPDNHVTMTPEEIKNSEAVDNNLPIDGGVTAQLHIIFIGVHWHESLNQEQICLRIGPGLNASWGTEVLAQAEFNENNRSEEDKKYNPQNIQFGVGIDIATASDLGASVLVNDAGTVEVSGGLRGYGIGASFGIDICKQIGDGFVEKDDSNETK